MVSLWITLLAIAGIYFIALYAIYGYFVSVLTSQFSPEAGFVIVTSAILLFSISIFIQKKLPHRFLDWTNLKIITRDRLLLDIFGRPPILNALYSLALSFYLFSFLDPNILKAWKNTSFSFESVYWSIAAYGVLGPLFMVTLLNFILIPLFLISKIVSKKNLFVKTSGVFIYIIIIFLFVIAYYLFVPDEDLMIGFMVPIAQFIIGSVSIGWFYELFIGSLAKKIEKQ